MGRDKNNVIESQRVKWLIIDLNNRLKNKDPELIEFLKNVNIDINFIKEFCNSSNIHHDLQIVMKDGSIKKIEHKGPNINKISSQDKERPWIVTPQLINATCQFTDISNKYAEDYYNNCLPMIINEFPNLPDRPKYEYWKRDDASPNSVKTDFGKALKEIRKNNNNKKIINDIIENFNSNFLKDIEENHPKMIKQLEDDCTHKMINKLKEKHLWLNVFYKTSNTIDTEISNSFLTITPQLIGKVTFLRIKKSKNLHFVIKYRLTSNQNKEFEGQAYLNWGNGKGIANIRWLIN